MWASFPCLSLGFTHKEEKLVWGLRVVWLGM